MRCAIYGCSVNNKYKTYNGEISFHSFPKQKQMCKQWSFLCRRKDKINTKTARICCKHFKGSDFVPVNPLYEQYGLTLKSKRLKEDVVPSLFLPLQKKEHVSSARNFRMQSRSSGSTDTIMEEEEPRRDSVLSGKVDCSTQTELSKVDCNTQTDEIMPTYSQLQEEIIKLKAQCRKQKTND